MQIICRSTRCAASRECSPPKRNTTRSFLSVHMLPGDVVDCRGLLPLNRPSTVVLCPSVFAKTGWVCRPLSTQELYRAFDLPLPAIPTEETGGIPGEALWQLAPPSKVLQRAYLQWAPDTCLKYVNMPAAGKENTAKLAMYNSAEAHDLDLAFVAAIKADGAEVPVFLWNSRVWALGTHNESRVEEFRLNWSGRCPLDAIRAGLLRHWRRRVCRSLLRYLRATYGTEWHTHTGTKGDLESGRDCLARTAAADWWEWRGGSTPYFWRWPPHLRQLVTQGHPSWLLGPLPAYKQPQRYEPDVNTRAKVKEKLENVLAKGYIEKGTVTSLTSYFAVPKGTEDVRLVYDAARSGLNKVLWAPTFPLPSVDTLTDMVEPSSWMADLDMGEQFHNFPLDVALRPACGIDVRPYFAPRQKDTMWLRWERCMMGLLNSPYVVVKITHLADESAYGNPADPANPFNWSHVRLNLPGMPEYSPQSSWVARLRVDGTLAACVPRYVDDSRPVGNSKEDCWRVTHTIAARYGYMGLQITSRKVRPPSQRPGAWSGAFVSASADGVGVSCGQEKWNKAKRILDDLQAQLLVSTELPHKDLEQKRGFLVHLQRTYPCITPFIKGIHLTLDSWRPGRDSKGWKDPTYDPGLTEDMGLPPPLVQPPARVTAVPRLQMDLEALLSLFSAPHPPTRYVRATHIQVALYGFGDASGSGFGSSIALPDGCTLFRHGLWSEVDDSSTSNYRELNNLVTAIEEGIAAGHLQNTELFLFTDNSTAEGAFFKGNSPSRPLFDLILRLRTIEMQGLLKLHVIHVAGSRMIAQGTDGLSRGDFSTGVMSGTPMLQFVPLHLGAIERWPALLPWLQTWTNMSSLQPLTPEQWYTLGHGLEGGIYNEDGCWFPQLSTQTTFLWAPPPAAAYAAVDELAMSRHKRTHLSHIFLCPRLCTHMWRKKLYKTADIVLELPPRAFSPWPCEMHEPLILAFVLPFLPFFPWELRSSTPLLDLGRQVQDMWKGAEGDVGPLLWQLLNLSPSMASMSGSLVRELLHPPCAG
jgi:hypothetical protein